MDILKVGEWDMSFSYGLGLNGRQKFQESLSKNTQDTEYDQYFGRQEAFATDATYSSLI